MLKESRRYLILDYESRSEANLKKVGSWEYSCHPTTQILCVAWRLGTREELPTAVTKVWSPFIASPYGELIKALCDPEIKVAAHNSLFEESITHNTLPRIINRPELKNIPPERWICTASLAAALALPRSLGGACAALGLSMQKDTDGHKLMLRLCKPKKITRKSPKKWHDTITDLKRLMQYCVTDVDAETELFLRLPRLHPVERKVWELDQKINLRGFKIDIDLVDKTLSMIAEEKETLDEECDAITWGGVESATQRAKVLEWLQNDGVYLPNLRSKTVIDSIAGGDIDGDPLRMLEIRQAIAKTSTAKYNAFKMRSQTDLRIRDNLVYHAASTGRWGGAGVQPQNFPRGIIKDTQTAIEAVKTGDIEWVRTLYGQPMNVFASCLRGAIIPDPGNVFFCADYAAIETRMAFWFAKHEVGIKAFTEDRDLYREMAASVYNKPIEEIGKDSIERFVGKGLILGCAYNMGGKKFRDSCALQGVTIDANVAELAVKTYRKVHYPIVKLWYNIENAAIAAIQNPGKRFTINYTTWFVRDGFLWCELPSGRKLAYYGAEIQQGKTPWGEDKAMIYHWSVNPRTRKWELAPTYGGKLVENVVQAASRDLMAWAMLRIDQAGYQILLSVHDEILSQRSDGNGSVKEFEDLMAELPPWATGAPVKAVGWSGDRYRK